MKDRNFLFSSFLTNLGKPRFVFFASASLLAIIIFVVLFFRFIEHSALTSELLFRSWESRSENGGPIYNKVKFFKKADQDIWMMNQSHHGLSAEPQKWDRLAIVIKNKTANFYQLPPGALTWTDDLIQKKIELKIDCRFCHANGPRAIRPAPDFKEMIDTKEKISLFIMNLRIKSYGTLRNILWTTNVSIPPLNVEKIKITTCTKCHNGGAKANDRSELTLFQRETIRFLVENRQMPPFGHRMSQMDLRALNEILN